VDLRTGLGQAARRAGLVHCVEVARELVALCLDDEPAVGVIDLLPGDHEIGIDLVLSPSLQAVAPDNVSVPLPDGGLPVEEARDLEFEAV
jgi:hypothetical protein